MKRSSLVPPLLAALALAGCGADAASARDLGFPVDASDPAPPDDLSYPARHDLARVDAGGGPPYPIVLVHGMAGFRNIGPVDYFYGIPAALRSDGNDVWISRQDPVNDSETRGAQLQLFVEQVLAQTHKAKVNLIAHSQGGFDARWVASRMGDRVASVMLVASPMKGTPVADLATSGGPGAAAAVALLLDLYGAANGYDSNAQRQLKELSTAGAAAFFAKSPDDPRVAYFSITGRSSGAGNGDDPECASLDRPEFVEQYDAARDPLDPLLAASGAILDAQRPRVVHDGLVPVDSARHGVFLGCVPADHMDEVHQLLGDAPGQGNPLDAVRLYRDLVGYLRWSGF